MLLDQTVILDRAIRIYGEDAQIEQAIEELSELILALQKHKRHAIEPLNDRLNQEENLRERTNRCLTYEEVEEKLEIERDIPIEYEVSINKNLTVLKTVDEEIVANKPFPLELKHRAAINDVIEVSGYYFYCKDVPDEKDSKTHSVVLITNNINETLPANTIQDGMVAIIKDIVEPILKNK